jgi:hypothetical protein
MMFPAELDPRWIDWNKAKEGGFRFVACTDRAGEPLIGHAHLSPYGEMIDPPPYQRATSTHLTAVLHTAPDNDAHVWRFVYGVDEHGLFVAVRRSWTDRRQEAVRRVSWFADCPATSF